MTSLVTLKTILLTAFICGLSAVITAHEPAPGVLSSISGADQVLVKAIDPFAEDPLVNGVPGARVVLINNNTSATDTLLTNAAGEAQFSIDPTGSYEVKILDGPIPLPLKVSVYDMLIIQKHLIGIKNIDVPQLLIAGDVNNNCNLSVSDLIGLRSAILVPSQLDALPWKFYPEDIVFFNPAMPCAGNSGTSYTFNAADYPGPDPIVFVFEGYAGGNVSGY
ncbi:MAG: hypothetical protein K9I85_14225 [Saprospiraceae bacterium]|nr:hypothetical protein [Saprospiraceae bacterium]